MAHPGINDTHRLFPTEPHVRSIASELYERVASLPILSPHGHVPAAWLAANEPFSDPADLLVVHDHYVTRVLHSVGVSLDALGQGESEAAPREIWRLLCEHWYALAGTASAGWLRQELASLFDITEELGPENADSTYDAIAAALETPAFRPRALFESFGIEALATTDDPLDDLAHHTALRQLGAISGRVLPTFRPDAYLDPDAAQFGTNVQRLLATTGEGSTSYSSYVHALQSRRHYFIDHGAVSADHGVVDPYTVELEPHEMERLFQQALRGGLDQAEARQFRGHMLMEMARMSVDDGLVMTVHAGVCRNHHSPTYERFGPDTGHDIPLRTEFTRNLRPLLERFGAEPAFHLVLFTVDETTFSRELAPLAGFYPSVYMGAPWWFLDAPDAIRRYREAVTETAGFYKTSGFIDDTRAYLSIPARHDTSRRVDAGYLARLVAEGRVSMSTAERIIVDLVDTIPRGVFKL